MSEPDYIVLRGLPGVGVEGMWFDRADMPRHSPDERSLGEALALVQLEPTGEFEFREDGAVAEVWRPIRPR